MTCGVIMECVNNLKFQGHCESVPGSTVNVNLPSNSL